MSDNKTKKKRSTRKEMPFLDHLEELRWGILKSLGSVILFTIITFPFTGALLTFLTYPNTRLKEPAELIFLKPTGMLMVRLEIAVVVGIIASLPVIFYQFWQFISPGLLPKERHYFLPALFFTTFCFLSGTAFAYLILIPTVLPFLFSMGTEVIKPTINITEYMSFALRLILISGLIFELPILSFILSVTGLVQPKTLKKYRKYGIVIIFISAALLTPPDPISQLLMAFPLLILYEISIWVSYLGVRKKKAKDDAWDEEYNSSPSKDKKKKAAD